MHAQDRVTRLFRERAKSPLNNNSKHPPPPPLANSQFDLCAIVASQAVILGNIEWAFGQKQLMKDKLDHDANQLEVEKRDLCNKIATTKKELALIRVVFQQGSLIPMPSGMRASILDDRRSLTGSKVAYDDALKLEMETLSMQLKSLQLQDIDVSEKLSAVNHELVVLNQEIDENRSSSLKTEMQLNGLIDSLRESCFRPVLKTNKGVAAAESTTQTTPYEDKEIDKASAGEYYSKISLLEQEITICKSALETSISNERYCESKAASLEESLAKCQSELETSSINEQTLAARITTLEDNLSNYKAQLEAVSRNEEQLVAKTVALEQELAIVTSRLAGAVAKESSLLEKATTFEQNLQICTAQLETAACNEQELVMTISSLQQDLNVSQSKLDALTSKELLYITKTDTLEHTLENCKSDLEIASIKEQKLSAKVAALEQQLHSSEETYLEATRKLTQELESVVQEKNRIHVEEERDGKQQSERLQAEAHQLRIKEMEALLNERNELIEKGSRELIKIHEEYQVHINRLEQLVKEKDQIIQTNSEAAQLELQTIAARHQREIQEFLQQEFLASANRKLQETVQQQCREIDQSCQKIKYLQEWLDEKNQLLEAMDKEKSSILVALDSLHRDHEQLQNKATLLETQMIDQNDADQSRLHSYQTKINHLESEIMNERETVLALEDRIQTISAEHETLKNNNNELEANLFKAQATCETLSSTNAGLESQIAEYERHTVKQRTPQLSSKPDYNHAQQQLQKRHVQESNMYSLAATAAAGRGRIPGFTSADASRLPVYRENASSHGGISASFDLKMAATAGSSPAPRMKAKSNPPLQRIRGDSFSSSSSSITGENRPWVIGGNAVGMSGKDNNQAYDYMMRSHLHNIVLLFVVLLPLSLFNIFEMSIPHNWRYCAQVVAGISAAVMLARPRGTRWRQFEL